MATPYTDAYVRYDGNGVTTEFSIDFDYKAESEIKVYIKRGNESQITLPSSDYSFVTKNTLKFPASGSSETVLAVGDVLAIQRESEFASEYVFDNQRRLEPVEVMNSDDNLERQIQELKRDVSQAIRIQPTSNIDTNEYFIAVESVYENIENINTVAGISGDVVVCSDNIEAIKDAPNQASAAAQYATEASQSVDESMAIASEAKSSADNADASANAAAQSATAAETARDEAIIAGNKATIGNIGDIQFTIRSDVPNGSVWCDGTEYSKAEFPDVYAMLVSGSLYNTTYEIFNNSVSVNGSCGFFALDSANEKFKVPSLNNIALEAGQLPSSFMAESLPQHTHTYQHYSGASAEWTGSSKSARNALGNFTTGKADNPTYQDGAKVKTDRAVYRAYVVMYTGETEVSDAVVSEVLNSCARKDLSNVPAEYDYVVESHYGDEGWYRVYKSGWVEQGGITDGIENQVVTFLKPLSGLPKVISAFGLFNSSTNYVVFTSTTAVTNTSMTVLSGGWKESGVLAPADGKVQKVWFVAGQGATE